MFKGFVKDANKLSFYSLCIRHPDVDFSNMEKLDLLVGSTCSIFVSNSTTVLSTPMCRDERDFRLCIRVKPNIAEYVTGSSIMVKSTQGTSIWSCGIHTFASNLYLSTLISSLTALVKVIGWSNLMVSYCCGITLRLIKFVLALESTNTFSRWRTFTLSSLYCFNKILIWGSFSFWSSSGILRQGSKFALRIRRIAKNCECEANSLRFAAKDQSFASLSLRILDTLTRRIAIINNSQNHRKKLS